MTTYIGTKRPAAAGDKVRVAQWLARVYRVEDYTATVVATFTNPDGSNGVRVELSNGAQTNCAMGCVTPTE